MQLVSTRACVLAALFLSASPVAQRTQAEETPPPGQMPPDWCRVISRSDSLRSERKAELEKSAAAGSAEARDPAPLAPLPQRPDRSPYLAGRVPCVTTDQIFVFQDADVPGSLDLDGIFGLMTRAANEVIQTHGDVFDFFAYFVSICPSWGFGAAFYLPIFNEIGGIGDPSGIGTPIFDDRATLGINSQRALGYIMMHGIDIGFWAPGNDLAATNTRLVLAHEFGHRWACFLPPLADGRHMQGGAHCGVPGHWNWQIDSQASCLYLQNYVGQDPAVRDSTFGSILDFNRDTGGAFSWMELYLMGFATANEMDVRSSELRYLHDACLDDSYSGPISDFSSADIIATAGPRVPGMASSQKHHRVAWIMLEPPGSPATPDQLADMAGIMQQQMLDWNAFTLGRGTLDVTLFDQCTDVQSYGCATNPIGSLRLASGEPHLSSSLVFEIDNPLGTQAPGALPVLAVSLAPDPAFPCGTIQPNWGMNGDGELLLDFTPGMRLRTTLMGAPWMGPGQPSAITLELPPVASLVGLELFLQGALIDMPTNHGVRVGLTDAIQVTLGP